MQITKPQNDEEAGAKPESVEQIFIDENALATRWHKSPKTLQNWRVYGHGPPFVKLGRSVRYRLSDVEVHERERTVRSTSEL